MTNKQINRLEMYRTSRDYLWVNKAKLDASPMFSSLFDRFQGNIKRIEGAADMQINRPAGKTAAKKDAADRMKVAANAIRGVVYAYARGIGDQELMAKLKSRSWTLLRLRHSESIRIAALIYQEALAVREQIVPYAVNQEALDHLRLCIDAATMTTGNRDQSIVDRKTMRKELDIVFAATDALLTEEFDNFLAQFRNSDATLFNGYRSARQTKTLGVRHEKKNGVSAQTAVDTDGANGTATHEETPEAVVEVATE